MENFYKKIRIRTDSKPRLMTAITVIFYILIGTGFVSSRYNSTITVLISCLLCGYMATLVYAMVKGKVLKAAAISTLPFVLGVLLRYLQLISVNMAYAVDIPIAFGMFVVFFGLGLALGHAWYGKYI